MKQKCEWLKEVGCIKDICSCNTGPKQETKYPIGGFAPGNYMCNCVTCKTQFIGDKRAVQCEPCAIEMIENIRTPIIKSVTSCPTCGTECTIEGTTTHHYIPKKERMYSEEEVLELLTKAHFVEQNIVEWFEQFKKKKS